MSDFFNILWVIDLNKDTELQFEFLHVDIQASDFSLGDFLWHLHVGSRCLEGVALHNSALKNALSVSLDDFDSLNWVFVFAHRSNRFDVLEGVDTQFGEQVALSKTQ